jgi:alkaline phosphatase D
MLGKGQEHWLATGWAKSGARWNVLAQTLMLTGMDQIPGPARGVYTDNWSGYPAGRQRLLELVKARRAAGATNFISLGGDIHGYFVGDVREDDTKPDSPILMSEFVGTSITSESFKTALFTKLLPENPQIKFMDDRHRGYVLCDVTPDLWRSTLRIVDNVRVRDPVFSTLATFVVENGKDGAKPG